MTSGSTKENTPIRVYPCASVAEPRPYQEVRNAVEANPKGIVASSPGLRACELPWEIVQTTSQPRWGWLVPTRWAQGSSFLATLGFVAESLRDSRNSSSKMWVMIRQSNRRF